METLMAYWLDFVRVFLTVRVLVRELVPLSEYRSEY